MKTTNALLTLLLLTAAVACQDESESAQVLSDEEAAEMIASSLAEDASGVTAMLEDVTATADEALSGTSGGRVAACGYTKSLDLTKTNPGGTLITYSYDYSYYYALVCSNEEVPTSFVADVDFDGEFDAPRLASEHSGTGELSITALDGNAANYLVNGTYSASGMFASKIRNKNTSNSSITITLEDVVVDKASHQILSGAASVSMMGEVSGKGGFTYHATIIFGGSGNAQVTVEGSKYTIDLETGAIDG